MSYIGAKNQIAIYDSFTKEQAKDTFAPISRSGRNLIINGGFNVQQRSGGGSGYAIDRWLIANSGFSLNANTITADFTVSKYRSYLQCTSGKPTLGSTDYALIIQRIEGDNITHLDWGIPTARPVTLSFTVRSVGFTGPVSVALRSGDVGRSFVTTVQATNELVRHSITIPGPTSGSFPRGNGRGTEVIFTMAAGPEANVTSVTSTLNTWLDGNFFASTTQVNGCAATNNELNIADVQLEVGDTATEFELRPYAEELALCQRYYTVIDYVLLQATGSTLYVTTPLPVRQRVAGTLSYDIVAGSGFVSSTHPSSFLLGATASNSRIHVNNARLDAEI